MKHIVIKVVIILLSISVYFNVSQFLNVKRIEENNTLLQENVSELETQITTLEDQLSSNEEVDSCQRLYDIEVVVVSDGDSLYETLQICTNKNYLGDALDEASEELRLVFDPRYDKEYIYGRMAVSFYGIAAQPGEFYQININGSYATMGVDFIQLEDGYSYSFTLVRWDV